MTPAGAKAGRRDPKPCPFCGSTEPETEGGIAWRVWCPECLSEGPLAVDCDSDEQGEAEAIRLWNNRAAALVDERESEGR